MSTSAEICRPAGYLFAADDMGLHSERYGCSNSFKVIDIGIPTYSVSYHQFADDTQLLASMDSTNATLAIDKLAHCSAAVRLWFLQNGLQLNADKSEVVLLGTLLSSGQLPTSPPSTLLEALWRSHRSSSRLA